MCKYSIIKQTFSKKYFVDIIIRNSLSNYFYYIILQSYICHRKFNFKNIRPALEILQIKCSNLHYFCNQDCFSLSEWAWFGACVCLFHIWRNMTNISCHHRLLAPIVRLEYVWSIVFNFHHIYTFSIWNTKTLLTM